MIDIIKTRESRRAFQVMPVNRIKLRLKKSSDLQEMTPLDAGSRLHDAGHKGVLGKRSSDQVMELTPANSIPGIFFGKGSTEFKMRQVCSYFSFDQNIAKKDIVFMYTLRCREIETGNSEQARGKVVSIFLYVLPRRVKQSIFHFRQGNWDKKT